MADGRKFLLEEEIGCEGLLWGNERRFLALIESLLLSIKFFPSVLVLLACLSLISCSKVSSDTSTDRILGSGYSNVTFAHDFGVLKPGEIRECLFEILNASGEEISIDRLKASCRCLKISVPKSDFSNAEIIPVRVEYRAPNSIVDDIQTIRLELRGRNQDRWPKLMLRSAIRNDLHLNVDTLEWSFSLRDELQSQRVILMNYSSEDFMLPVISKPHWITVFAAEKDVPPSLSGQVRQVWEFELGIDNSLLDGNGASSVVNFSVEGSRGKYEASVHAKVSFRSALSVFPNSVLLTDRVRYLSVRALDLVVDYDCSKRSLCAADFDIDNPFPELVTIEIERRTDQRWVLQLECIATLDRRKDGVLRVRVPSICESTLEIPVAIEGYVDGS